MGKKIKILTFLLSTVILFSTCQNIYNSTPKEYKNITTVSSTMYQSDTSEIRKILERMLNEHLHPFRPKEHFDSASKIHLDTLIYSPDKLRMIVFVITENNTNKLESKTNNAKMFFNGNYLFCLRESLSSRISVYDYSSSNFVHYYQYNDLKTRLYNYCFRELSYQTFNGEKQYNIDDLRFWNSDVFKWVVVNSKATTIIN